MGYLRCLFATTAAMLTVVASINFFADPAGVYAISKHSPTQFVEALIHSENGLWWPENSVEDRAIKESLARHSDKIQCVVIGSSHVMQIGSSRKLKSLEKTCPSILNLGVSGASLEDQLTLVYLALKNGRPNKIVLGVDPWTLAFGKGQGWTFYASAYQDARHEILRAGPASDNGAAYWGKFKNLISLDYTIRSVQKIASEWKGDSSLFLVTPVQRLDEVAGGDHAVFFRDGSLNYSAKTIELSVQPIQLGGVVYNTDGAINERAAIGAYKLLLKWIISKGVTPILLMTPYHHNVWKAADSPTTRALVETEPIVREIGDELNINVVGSFNPGRVGCSGAEFYDYMHPKPSCLARLERYSTR